MLAGAIDYFRYLKIGLSFVLVFIGVKMLIDPHSQPEKWFQVEIPSSVSLLVVAAILATSIALSITAGKRDKLARLDPERIAQEEADQEGTEPKQDEQKPANKAKPD